MDDEVTQESLSDDDPIGFDFVSPGDGATEEESTQQRTDYGHRSGFEAVGGRIAEHQQKRAIGSDDEECKR